MGKISTRRKVAFVVVIYVGLVGLAEVGARAWFFVTDDFNPYYLGYGLVNNTEWHSDERDGYSKFQPNTIRHDQEARDSVIDMKINSDGFRGLEDFVTPKPVGTYRIVALGASSTFGYHNQDDETYPVQLERQLSEQHPDRAIDVYNLGIPHLRLNNVLALARSELARLQPDVVTLYAGYNNSILTEDRKSAGFLFKIKDWLVFHSVAWTTIHELVRNAYYKIAVAAQKDFVGLPHLSVPIEVSPEDVERLRTEGVTEFVQDVEALAAIVEELDAKLVLVTQSMTLHGLSPGFGEPAPTYREEVESIEAKLAARASIDAIEAVILRHEAMMDAIWDVAARRGLDVVDGLHAIDADRGGYLASFVHLTPQGNGALAAVIAGVVGTDLVPQEGVRLNR